MEKKQYRMYMLTPQEIRAIRESLKMSPTEFAAAVGVCENTARRWEIGDRHPRYDTMVKINELAERLQADRARAV